MALLRTLLLCAGVALPVTAQSAFVELRGTDTIAVERFTRTPARFDGDLQMTGGPRIAYGYSLRPASLSLDSMTIAVYTPGAPRDAAPVQRGTIDVFRDTAVAAYTVNGQPTTQRIPTQVGAQVLINTSVATLEPLVAAARRLAAPTATLPVFLVMGGTTHSAQFSGLQTDSVTIVIAGLTTWVKLDPAGRVLRGGVPQQGLTFTRVDGPAASRLGARPNYAAPAGAPYAAESVTVPTTMGHTLGGTLTRPAVMRGRVPVAITITGSGAQDRDEYISSVPNGYRLFRQVADTLGKRGIAVLRLDDRGYGDSGGDFAKATSRDFANDIRAAIAWLRTRDDIDHARIFLVGHSEGGMVAPMVAVDEPALAGIVLMAGPARTGREIIRFQARYAIEHDTTATSEKKAEALAKLPAQVDSVLRTSPWLTFFGDHDPVAVIRRVRQPVLILQGGDDQQVIADEARTLESALKSVRHRDVTTHVFPALNHLFIHQPGGNPAGYTTLPTNLADARVLGILADWIVTRAERPLRR